MKAFELTHAQTVADAVAHLSGSATARPMSGGQDLLGLMKDYIVSPDRVVDLKQIPGLDKIEADQSAGLRIGALVTLTDLAESAVVRDRFQAIAQAAESVGSLQIRNVGTVGGNLCQRPRCWYFRNEHAHCLKKGGDRCYAGADDAQNKYHAIFGDGPCHIVHPSDLAPTLMCLKAVVHTAGPSGGRAIPLSAFYVLPEDGGIMHETVLGAGEIVTAVTVPASAMAARSTYVKFRERESFDWSLASVAMALAMKGATVADASIVLGGVAPAPWHVPGAEAALRGKTLSAAAIDAAAQAATQGANPLSKNGYKIQLVHALVRRAARSFAPA
jgi:xanthine dehydrogenase YagS FAD-binding subunit